MTDQDYLFHLELHGIKLGLDNIRHLLDAAGNPHRGLPALHVAGTNGKGSVVAFASAICREARYKTACFTSPHLIDVTERFLIDGVPISPEALDEQIGFFRAVAEKMDSPPTFFEMVTAVAFRWFSQNNVDIAIIEVGMGGRLDSTNVLTPLACAITNIDMDHMAYLGTTIEQIAGEKAGIIKKDTPVVIGERKPVPQAVLLNRAEEVGAPVVLIDRDFHYDIPEAKRFRYRGPELELSPVKLGLRGEFQAQNAAVAVALVDQIRPLFPLIDEHAIEEGLKNTHWPCRFEKVLKHPTTIIDVAHNPAGVRAIVPELRPGITILAVSADKDVREMIAALAPVTNLFIVTRYGSARSMPVEELATLVGDLPHQCAADLGEAIATGLMLASEAEPLLITGSIFTAGEARKILIDAYGAAPLRF